MAIVKRVSYRGQQSITSLSGNIRIDQANDRFVAYEPSSGSELNVIDSEGIKTFDTASGNEVVRNGKMPDGSYTSATANTGEDIKNAFS